MIKNLDDLKAFITWARDNKIKKVKMKGIEVEISDLAFIDQISSQVGTNTATDLSKSQMPEDNEEDLLFYSSSTS